MSELGYKRSGKKCREKFENVHKYYKRTRDGRSGSGHRQDGKTYKFFSELEALHAVTSSPGSSSFPPTSILHAPPVVKSMQPPIVSHVFPTAAHETAPLGLIFSSNSLSLSPGSSDDEDDEEDDVEGEPSTVGSGGKRKRPAETSSEGRKMMEYFEGLTKRVMRKQEEMNKRLLDAIEKREKDRIWREDAWRRQETYRLAREHELVSKERAASASRDAAIVSFLQKCAGQTIPPPQTHQPMPQPPPQQEIIGTSGGGGEVPSPSRWPKAEVLVLISLRSGMETKYQEAGPKGPLWNEISAGMRRLGYERSPKRCKEKWENINKYFKKVKESNRKRPDDTKTCPYFDELEKLYRKKEVIGVDLERVEKREDTVKEMDQCSEKERERGFVSGDKADDVMEDDSLEQDEDDDEDDDEEMQEERKMAYKIEYQQQRQNTAGTPNGGGNGSAAPSFATMVQ